MLLLDEMLLLADGETRVSIEVVEGFLKYLHSWDTIIGNTRRDTETKTALQQIVDTGVTGEACVSAHQPAPHIKN